MKPREKTARRVNAKLVEKFVNFPAIKRIHRHRQVPKHVFNARNEMRASLQSAKRKYVHLSAAVLFRVDFKLANLVISGSTTFGRTRSAPSRKCPSERKPSFPSKSDDPLLIIVGLYLASETRRANEQSMAPTETGSSFVCVYNLHNSCDGPFAFFSHPHHLL